jgi:hypothetical protein
MKKLFIVIIVIFSTVLANAQRYPTIKGGSIYNYACAFSSSSGELYGDEGLTTFTLGLDVSWFIENGFACGGNGSILYLKQGDSEHTSYGIGPQLAYYFGSNTIPDTIKGKVYPYIKISYLFNGIESGSSTTNGGTISGNVGLINMLNEHVGLNIFVQYSSQTYTSGSESESGGVISFGFGITGLSY